MHDVVLDAMMDRFSFLFPITSPGLYHYVSTANKLLGNADSKQFIKNARAAVKGYLKGKDYNELEQIRERMGSRQE